MSLKSGGMVPSWIKTLPIETIKNTLNNQYLNNFKSFTQVGILGSSTFVPFMQLSAPHRREVIEDLLDIQIFSQMNMLLKERMKDNREQLKECEHQLQLAEQAINSQKKTVDKLSAVNDERITRQQEKFKENENRMMEIKGEISLIETRVVGLKSMQEDAGTSILMKQVKSNLNWKTKVEVSQRQHSLRKEYNLSYLLSGH